MAIEEKYARIIQELQTKYSTQLTSWEKNEFLPSVVTFKVLSFGQKATLDKIMAKIANAGAGGQPQAPQGYGNRPHVDLPDHLQHGENLGASKMENGWQIFVNKQRVGPGMTFKDTQLVFEWLKQGLEDIIIATKGTDAAGGTEDAPF